jgi:long-chain acyl-CoA synthetase
LKEIEKFSAYLHSRGIRKGDKVSIILENCPLYVIIDQALMKLGAVNVSVYPSLTEKETEYIVNDSESKAIIIGSIFQ